MRAEENGMELTGSYGVYDRIDTLHHPYFPCLAHIGGKIRGHGAPFEGLFQYFFRKVVQINGGPASEVIASPGGSGNAQGKSRGGPLVGKHIAHSLDMEEVVFCFRLFEFLQGLEGAFSKEVTESLPVGHELQELGKEFVRLFPFQF